MVNRMILQGRLCSDPELRRTNSGTAVCSFRVAWSEKVKDRETKLFLSCVAWQSMAEMICKHFAKGKEIVVEGKLSSREYEDNSGNKRTVVELTADRVHFCGSKDSAPHKPAQTFEEISEDDGDLRPCRHSLVGWLYPRSVPIARFLRQHDSHERGGDDHIDVCVGNAQTQGRDPNRGSHQAGLDDQRRDDHGGQRSE